MQAVASSDALKNVEVVRDIAKAPLVDVGSA
jgi:hypothetical protein